MYREVGKEDEADKYLYLISLINSKENLVSLKQLYPEIKWVSRFLGNF